MNTMALRDLSYGVYVITTLDDQKPTGCIANSAMQITADPAIIAVSINHNNYTNQAIVNNAFFAISIVTQKTDPQLIGTFGFKCGKECNKFENIDYQIINNTPVFTDLSYLICKVVGSHETSTHTIFLGELVEADVLNNETPMTYKYYHEVVKGTSPKNAPTYQKEESTPTKEGWRCAVCGYIYDGKTPFEELPDTYTCPICSQPKEVFEKVTI
ncbi:MAG: flavin reductase [Erysipelotrichaceae bacterium]